MIPIPIPSRAYLYAGLAVLAALVIANTYRLSAAVDRARADLAECQATTIKLRVAIDDQNRAVDELKASADEAQQRAARAMEDVEHAERARQAVQSRLADFKRKDGEDECSATRRILSEYRK